MVRTVILDCDPGVDDAVALLLALASPDRIRLDAVTVTAGNVQLVHTTRNALGLVALAGSDVAVYSGAERAITRAMGHAPDIHGQNGLRDVPLAPHDRSLASGHAVDFLRARLRAAGQDPVTLCVIGPMTNLGLALATEPGIVSGISEIVVMGGALGLGNVTPAAEFNIWADPEAAAIVLASGAPITFLPLELTHQALATPEHASRLRATGRACATLVADILGSFPPLKRFDGKGIPMHDVCAVARLIAPELMDGKPCAVEIDCGDGPSRGKTVIDWWGKLGKPANATVLTSLDVGAFFELMIARISRL